MTTESPFDRALHVAVHGVFLLVLLAGGAYLKSPWLAYPCLTLAIFWPAIVTIAYFARTAKRPRP